MNKRILAGTGHRPDKLGGYSKEVTDKLIDLAVKYIPKDTTKIISGMALGWDMALAYAAIERNIPFIAAIPFKGQESKWPPYSQSEFNFLLEKAEEIVIVSDGGYGAWKMQVRNKWMVDHCDEVVSLWDGSAGGTANCIKYANSVKKPITNLWNKFNE